MTIIGGVTPNLFRPYGKYLLMKKIIAFILFRIWKNGFLCQIS
jgi:hypothetical protein